jgi:hypothetical protein
LIRRQGDRGVFVILSAAMPSRLLKAFPAGVPINRVALDEAIARVGQILSRPGDGLGRPKTLEGFGTTSAADPTATESSLNGPPPLGELGEE